MPINLTGPLLTALGGSRVLKGLAAAGNAATAKQLAERDRILAETEAKRKEITDKYKETVGKEDDAKVLEKTGTNVEELNDALAFFQSNAKNLAEAYTTDHTPTGEIYADAGTMATLSAVNNVMNNREIAGQWRQALRDAKTQRNESVSALTEAMKSRTILDKGGNK